MFKKLKEKAGTEILQVIVVVAILGAVAITVCWNIASQLRTSSTQATNALAEGTNTIYPTNTTP